MKVTVPWGVWDLYSGIWVPNPMLGMNRGEQHRMNLKNRYSCRHMRLPGRCTVCQAEKVSMKQNKKPDKKEVWQRHHISYDPERVVRIRRKVHYEATRLQRYKDLTTLEKEALIFIINMKPLAEGPDEKSHP